MRKHKRRIIQRLRIVAAFNGVRVAIRKAAQPLADVTMAMIAAAGGAFNAFAGFVRQGIHDMMSDSFAAAHVAARPRRPGPPSRNWWLR